MSRLPEPWPTLTARLAKLEEQLRRIGASSPFFGTGIHPNGHGGLDSDNYVPGESGYSFQGDTGDAEFNSLTLRGGIIGDDALASLLKGDYVFGSATGFGLSSTWTQLATNTLTVPAGLTRAVVTLTGGMFAYNPRTTGGSNGTGGDAWQCFVGSTPGYSSQAYPIGVSGSGGFASVHSHVSFTLTDLTPGQSVTFGLWGASSYQSIAANPDNRCDVSGTVLWLR